MKIAKKNLLRGYMKRVNIDQLLRCDICKIYLIDSVSLEKHQKRHKEYYTCDYCNCKIKYKRSLVKHFKSECKKYPAAANGRTIKQYNNIIIKPKSVSGRVCLIIQISNLTVLRKQRYTLYTLHNAFLNLTFEYSLPNNAVND